jgi:hypothetical protein
MLVGLAGVVPPAQVRAVEPMQTADADGDDVADDVDACPDSPAYDLVDAAGCSVCDCEVNADEEEWSSRGAYMRCVIGEIHARRLAKTLSRKAARLAVKAARKSTCGTEDDVRCCIMFPGKPLGTCKVMDEVRCDETMLGAALVEDLDSGSCFPNPCHAE